MLQSMTSLAFVQILVEYAFLLRLAALKTRHLSSIGDDMRITWNGVIKLEHVRARIKE